MPEHLDLVATDAGGHRERPFLFPWVWFPLQRNDPIADGRSQNRRLRHLQGISVRNLNIAPPAGRFRGKTIADDDVPYKSPTKRIKQESKALHHSRSSSDLASSTKKQAPGPAKALISYVKDDQDAVRPGGHRLRRRSTLHWTGASPRERQQKLEDVAAERMADTWFSIHARGDGKDHPDPIYVSEVMDKNMNPSFRFFDLDTSGPQVTRSDELRLMLWAKSWRMDEYHLLIDMKVNLRSLQFLGRTLENFHHPLPSNCVLFHLSDGIYTSFTDMPVSSHDSSALLTANPRPGEKDTTSSYDALMQLANLDECIQDALLTRQKMEQSIASLLSKHQAELDSTKRNIKGQEAASLADQFVATERKHIRQLSKRQEDLRKTLQLRKEVIASSQQTRSSADLQAQNYSADIFELREKLKVSHDLSAGQIRRIAETLSSIFPIEPLKASQKSLLFTIRGILLPNSSFDDTNRDSLAAALGFTSHLVHLLSLYLSAPLPYPIESSGSTSFIHDPISIALAQRKFPLHPVNVSYKFEYGVFLLNKDIEVLMAKVGLRMLDIRHTLPNLKYALYVLTAGTGEMPARKAGGIRGLMGGRVGSWTSTPSLSRRGSSESVASQSSYAARVNGSMAVSTGGVREKRIGEEDPFVSTSPRAKTLPFRSSLLRDA